MPELPEVETIRRQLEKEIVGRRIETVVIKFARRMNKSPAEFTRYVVGSRIVSLARRAKILLINLSNNQTIVIHLKMTGMLLLTKGDRPPEKHTHLIFGLSGKRTLSFEDVRKFGFVRLYPTAELESRVFSPAKFGLEPLSSAFTLTAFRNGLKRFVRSSIKALLLSQKCVVGVGNIYSDETLWRAGIKPGRQVGDLHPEEIKRLYSAIKTILQQAIKHGGSSVDNYRDIHGERGGYARFLKVYGRGGEKCLRCGGVIKKSRLYGRGTHWCPTCQN